MRWQRRRDGVRPARRGHHGRADAASIPRAVPHAAAADDDGRRPSAAGAPQRVSQTVCARYLNVSTSLVGQWKQGEKHPAGSPAQAPELGRPALIGRDRITRRLRCVRRKDRCQAFCLVGGPSRGTRLPYRRDALPGCTSLRKTSLAHKALFV